MNGIELTAARDLPAARISPNSANLQQALTHIHKLPAMPDIARKMLALPLNTDEGEAQLLKLIAQDPQISARIIGLSNASIFGAPGMISSISDAAMRLGLMRIKVIAIGMATIAAFSKQSEEKFKSADLWTHSLAIATVMRCVAKHMPARNRPLEDQIFLAGLLHDIGYSVLNFIAKDLSNALHDRLHTAADAPLIETEQALLGTCHGEIGAKLGMHWDLPPEIIAVIRHHHQPDHPGAAIAAPLVRLIHIAEKILPDRGIVEHTASDITAEEWIHLGIDPEEAAAITVEVKNAIAQLATSA